MTAPAPMETVSGCRSCGGPLDVLHCFGETPIADRLQRADATGPELQAPLSLALCRSCGLAQIMETVAPSALFGGDYPYYSSVSPALLRHFGDSARAIAAARRLGPDSLVVEAASNDGYMLSAFNVAGVPVLGVDPAAGPAAAAIANGVPTIVDFFGEALGRRLASEGRRADVFLANNVLAHVADLNGFVAGMAAVLKPDGLAVIECPYVVDLVDHGEFDTIYHQHLCYFSVTALAPLFARHGLVLNDVERVKVHGGSLRLFVSRTKGRSARADDLIAMETRRGVGHARFFADLVRNIAVSRRKMRTFLDAFRKDGLTIAGYGAAAKATTLLHALGVDRSDLPYIADRNPKKQGWRMPGVGIPIVSPEELAALRPDVIVILAWNFANEIMADMAAHTSRGGRFVIPVPQPALVGRQPLELAL